jgi:CheY-like chemotaxis protein
MDTILIADDDPVVRLVVRAILEPQGYVLHAAVDGKSARAILEQEGSRIKAIVLDWQMPEMSGIELLRWIKQQPEFGNTPVIMQTAMDSPENIREGIEAGAFYYLTKPIDEHLLPSVVRAALEDSSYKESLLRQLQESQNPLGILQEGAFQFRTLKEGERLALWIANACNCPAAAMGVNEIFINAIEHGNLGITYDEKTQYMSDGTWIAEVERRLALPECAGKHVDVRIARFPDSLSVLVQDQGPGFDYAQYLQFDEERVFHNHGRGIAMASSALDLQYRGNGNTVLVTIPIENTDGVG